MLYLSKMYFYMRKEMTWKELVVFLILYGSILIIEQIRKTRMSYIRLGLSVLLIVYITLLRRESGNVNVELIPFKDISLKMAYHDFLNIVLFFPFGYELTKIKEKNYKSRIEIYGFILSLLIESMQILFQCGNFETEDILFNGAGTLVGKKIYEICKHVKTREENNNENYDDRTFKKS